MTVKVKRKSYARLKDVYDIPNLIEIQVNSYRDFLQKDVPKTKRENMGLEALLREVFPLASQNGAYKLEYLYYDIKQPKYGPEAVSYTHLTLPTN